MTKPQFSLLLGLAGQTGCVIYDDALRRESSDVALDARLDAPATIRDATSERARPDAVAPDAEASGDAELEAGVAGDVTSGADARDAVARSDAADGVPDAWPPDVLLDARSEMAIEIDVRDAALDTRSDTSVLGCTVDFAVSGVSWSEDAATEGDAGARMVRLVGDLGTLGAWAPEAGLAMSEIAPGAWSVGILLADKIAIEFKFVKVPSGRAPEWEEWLPFESNRSLLVDCAAEGGTVWVDAAADAGPASRAVGRNYGGAFGVKPLDATK